jgi:hypothetical protein
MESATKIEYICIWFSDLLLTKPTAMRAYTQRLMIWEKCRSNEKHLRSSKIIQTSRTLIKQVNILFSAFLSRKKCIHSSWLKISSKMIFWFFDFLIFLIFYFKIKRESKNINEWVKVIKNYFILSSIVLLFCWFRKI